MDDYIKRSDTLELARGYYSQGLKEEAVPVKAIKNIPSADVVEVVRCKDCKSLSFVDRFCYKNSIFVCSMDWFCAGGERRDGGA